MSFCPFDVQDAQIQELIEKVTSMTNQTEQLQATISQQQSQIQQHKDQYNILKLKLGEVFCLSSRMSLLSTGSLYIQSCRVSVICFSMIKFNPEKNL